MATDHRLAVALTTSFYGQIVLFVLWQVTSFASNKMLCKFKVEGLVIEVINSKFLFSEKMIICF